MNVLSPLTAVVHEDFLMEIISGYKIQFCYDRFEFACLAHRKLLT
jgi:hypothetical protein